MWKMCSAISDQLTPTLPDIALHTIVTMMMMRLWWRFSLFHVMHIYAVKIENNLILSAFWITFVLSKNRYFRCYFESVEIDKVKMWQ